MISKQVPKLIRDQFDQPSNVREKTGPNKHNTNRNRNTVVLHYATTMPQSPSSTICCSQWLQRV